MVEAGLLLLPESAPWLVDFEVEFFGFPLSTHDDQVDSVTQFLKWVRTWASRIESAGAGVLRPMAEQAMRENRGASSLGIGSAGENMDGFA